MTFDIVFCVARGRDIPSFERIAAILQLSLDPSLTLMEKKVLTYERMNASTDVYFQLSYSQEDRGSEIRGAQHLIDSGLGAHVNFGRPSYFARECFDSLVSISKRLGLHIFYDQTLSSSELPQPTVPQLLQRWTAVNTAAITKVREDGGLVKFVPKDLLDIIWNYDMHKKDFVEKYYPKYFIPAKLFAIEHAGAKDQRCYTCCGWKNERRIIPIVEYALVPRLESSSYGYVSLRDFMEIMDGFYQAVSDPVPHLVLENSTETQVKSIRDKIAFIDSQTKVVPFDSIVDVPP